MIERIKNIILKPKTEWVTIEQEQPDAKKIFTSYVLPLILITTIFTILGWGLVGKSYGGFGFKFSVKGWEWGIQQGITTFLSNAILVFVSAWVIDLLAPSFKSEKNFGKSFQLVAYALTPMWIAGVFNIIPSLGAWLTPLAGIYGLVLLYFGIAPMKKTATESVTGYFVVSLIVMIVTMVIAGLIIGLILSSFWLSKSGMMGSTVWGG